MEFGCHGLLIRYSNVATDIMLAANAGYDAIELHTDKLDRYLAAGFTGKDINEMLEKYNIKVSCIDIIGDVETQIPEKWEEVMTKVRLLVDTAAEIGCSTIQLNAFEELSHMSVEDNIRLTAENIKKICAVGKEKGIRFQYEGAAWCPIHTLEDCVKLVEAVGMDNFGLVIDSWHFWASRGGTPEQVAKLDKNMIYGCHVSDGYRPGEGEPWVDETELRGALPGDGEINCQEWIDAVRATGYDGFFSGEILNHQLWEANLQDIATDTLKRLKSYF